MDTEHYLFLLCITVCFGFLFDRKLVPHLYVFLINLGLALFITFLSDRSIGLFFIAVCLISQYFEWTLIRPSKRAPVHDTGCTPTPLILGLTFTQLSMYYLCLGSPRLTGLCYGFSLKEWATTTLLLMMLLFVYFITRDFTKPKKEVPVAVVTPEPEAVEKDKEV